MEEDGDMPKTLVKLRRTPSDTPRPASTPPVIAASAIQDEDDEEKIIAELEVRHFKSPMLNRSLIFTLMTCFLVSAALSQTTTTDQRYFRERLLEIVIIGTAPHQRPRPPRPAPLGPWAKR